MLKKISKIHFSNLLAKKPLEDLDLVKIVEKELIHDRGYVFRMPKPGEPVVLLLSGGLDSITTWHILLEEFGLRVYPLTLDKGEKRRHKEEESIKFFSKYFKQKYSNLYVDPVNICVSIPNFQIPIEKASHLIHSDVLLANMDSRGEILHNLSLGSFLLAPLYAKMFAEHLYLTKNIRPSTIFCAVTTSDGASVPEQTFTTLRLIMWLLSRATIRKDWQFTSVAFEKELGLYLSKADLIQWANAHHLPLEKTWTCYRDNKYQCGDKCITCRVRRGAFFEAGVPDKTVYETDVRSWRLSSPLRLLRRWLR